MLNQINTMHKLITKTLLLILCLGLFSTASAVVEVIEFSSVEQETRYKNLIAELRCPKCQNQNLLDSDAPIAADLRRKTRSLVNQGKTNNEIKTYMLERYGDFVLYKPRFTMATAFLWVGPFILLLIVILVLWSRIKKKQDDELLNKSMADNEAVRIKVRNLMKNAPVLDETSNGQSKQD